MTAEYQVLSPVVSTRECYFVRHCKQQGDGIWAVVDVSIDHLFPNLELKCRRRPSGCLIQQIENGFCKVLLDFVVNCLVMVLCSHAVYAVFLFLWFIRVRYIRHNLTKLNRNFGFRKFQFSKF